MATLTYNKTSKAHIIQFRPAGQANRVTLYLGKMGAKPARAVAAHVEHLLNSKASRQPVPLETAAWVGGIDDELHAKIAKYGLVHPREGDSHKSKRLLDSVFTMYIGRRTDLKPRTITNLKQCQRQMNAFFGKRRDIQTITKAEATDWKRALASKLSGPTVSTHIKKARQLFADAVDRKLIATNPFVGVKAGKQTNKEKMQYVPAADVVKVMDACTTPQWRLLFAFARFGGLRVPSETSLLKWDNIDWSESRIVVTSPKTEHHQGKAWRIIPLFPELLQPLLDVFEKAGESEYVLCNLRRDNLRTQAKRAIDRAKVAPWPRLFQNLRSSCQTDLTTKFPLHVACAWVGNTEAVALGHYLQVTAKHFADALGDRAAFGAAVRVGQDRTLTKPEMQKPLENQGFCTSGIPPRGAEHPASSLENLLNSKKALHGALCQLLKAAPAIRQSEIDRLEKALDEAKGAK